MRGERREKQNGIIRRRYILGQEQVSRHALLSVCRLEAHLLYTPVRRAVGDGVNRRFQIGRFKSIETLVCTEQIVAYGLLLGKVPKIPMHGPGECRCE